MDSDSVDDLPVRDTGGSRNDKVSEQKRSQQRRAVAKISREELEDQYLRLHDENLILKRHARKQEEKIKKMATKLLRLVQDTKKKDGDTGAGGTGARRKGGRDIETEEMIEEQQQRIRDLEKNCEAYKKKLMVAKQQIATQSQRRTPYNHVQSRINTGMPKPPADSVQRNLRVQGNRTGSATPRSIRNDVLPRYGHSLLEEARAENQRLNEEIDNLHENCQFLDQEKEILMEQVRWMHKQRMQYILQIFKYSIVTSYKNYDTATSIHYVKPSLQNSPHQLIVLLRSYIPITKSSEEPRYFIPKRYQP
nr:protein fantom-like [Lytechinus pictus]